MYGHNKNIKTYQKPLNGIKTVFTTHIYKNTNKFVSLLQKHYEILTYIKKFKYKSQNKIENITLKTAHKKRLMHVSSFPKKIQMVLTICKCN